MTPTNPTTSTTMSAPVQDGRHTPDAAFDERRTDPEIVALDELTTGLDPAARRDTWTLVRRLRDEGVTVVLVTHAMNEVEALCDRLVVIVAGRVAAAGTPAEVTGDHPNLEAAYLAIVDRCPEEV